MNAAPVWESDGALDFFVGRASTSGWNSGMEAVHGFFNDCGAEYTEVEFADSASGFDVSAATDLYGTADLDQDGDLDIVGWDTNDGDGWTWLNGGDGQTWSRLPPSTDFLRPFYLEEWGGDGGEGVSLPIQDVTGDGYPDLVECGSTNYVAPTNCHVHRGDGDGTFTADFGEFTIDQNVNGFTMADFDGDGALDFLGGFDDDLDAGQGWIWFGDPADPAAYPSGAGTPAFDVTLPDPPALDDNNEPGWAFPVAYDWDGDGDQDVVVSVVDPMNSEDRMLYIALNDGLGSFTVSPIGPSTGTWGTSGNLELVQDVNGVPVWP